MDEGLRKYFAALRRNRVVQSAVRVAYIVALAVYTVWTALTITYIPEAALLNTATGFFMSVFNGYFVFYLFGVFLLDAFLNGLSMRKVVFGVIAVLLLQCLVTNAVSAEAQKNELQFFVWLLLAYPKRLELRSALSAVWVAGGIFVASTVALSLAGIIPNNASSEFFGIPRCSFGFTNQNTESMFVCSLVMAWVYCNSFSWNWRKATAALVLPLVVFVTTGSIVNVAIAVMQILMTCLLKQEDRWAWVKDVLSRIICRLGVVLIPTLAVVCLVLVPVMAAAPDFGLFKVLDALLGGGLAAGCQFFEIYGYSIFGRHFEPYGYLNNSYVYVAISLGLVCLSCLVVLYCRLGLFLEQRRDCFMSLYVSLLAVHFLTDPIMLLPAYNIAVLAIGFYLAIGPGIAAYESAEDGEC